MAGRSDRRRGPALIGFGALLVPVAGCRRTGPQLPEASWASDPPPSGVGVDDEYDIDRVLDHRRAECRHALLDQGAVVAAFIAVGGVLIGGSRVVCRSARCGSSKVLSERVMRCM